MSPQTAHPCTAALASIPSANLNKYLGKGFAYGGRGPDVYDCYGLVKAIHADRGIDLPEYLSTTDKSLIHEMVMQGRGLFVSLDKPEPWCVVTFAIHPRFVSHVGVVLDDSRRFIHIMEKTSVTAERLDAPEWVSRTRGFYKWAK